MKKKIICILISGIFLVTIFSSINTNAKAVCVPELSETKDTVCKNKIELIPLPEPGDWGFVLALGDFHVEGDTIQGHADVFFGVDGTNIIPIPFIVRDTDIIVPLHAANPNQIYWLRYNDHRIIVFTLFS